MVEQKLQKLSAEADSAPQALVSVNDSFWDYNANVSKETRKDPMSGETRGVFVFEVYRFPKSFGKDEIVNGLIRLRYSESNEIALLRQQASKKAEYREYDSYCESCKALAQEILEKVNG